MIPVFRPLLPTAEAIFPYLKRIDQTRWYSNYGPLYEEMRSRLAALFRVDDDQLVLVSNATVGISLALRAVTSPHKNGACLMPSWTFNATAHAALSAGLQPAFVDVDEERWVLDLETVPAQQLDRAAALCVVSPFGAPLNSHRWERVVEERGVPVVIDAAGSIDAVARAPEFEITSTPVVISLHATKALGIGEGAIVLCADPDVIERVRQMANFGFSRDSVAQTVGTNAKLSEYSCAVGLAALDAWPDVRERLRGRSARYAAAFRGLEGVSLYGQGADYAAPYAIVRLEDGDAHHLASALRRSGIETRRWWRSGCHQHPAFASFPANPLPVTRRLSRATLGLPYFVDITNDQIAAVADGVARFAAR